jgi:hypothetical protein
MLHKLGFTQCDVDQAIFLQLDSEHGTIVLVHIDDCTIAALSLDLIVSFKDTIKEHVEITDLGELHWLHLFLTSYSHVHSHPSKSSTPFQTLYKP